MKVNGVEIQQPIPVMVSSFLESHGYDRNRTAIELNGTILPRREYDRTPISDEDSLEIVSFVGGG